MQEIWERVVNRNSLASLHDVKANPGPLIVVLAGVEGIVVFHSVSDCKVYLFGQHRCPRF